MELTHSQLRMWFMNTIAPDRTDLTIACAARLNRRLGVTELQDRLRAVVEGHPLLSAMVVDDGHGPQWRPVDREQAVRGAVRPALRAASADDVHKLYEEFTGGPWRLDRDVPWAVQLVTAGTAEYLFCAFHHIVCDGDRSLRLFLAGLSGPRVVPPAPALTDLLTDPERAASWDDSITRLTGAVTDLGDPRERIAVPATGGARWSGVVDSADGADPDERDEVALLRRLGAATADLVGPGQQLLAAIPFDACTPAQQDQIGYFGNPGLAVLPADGPDGSWAGHEYARAGELAGIPFQTVMADAGFRAAAGKDNPFDILLVPRSLLTFASPLVRSVSEPAASRTPYALVLNHWRDAAGDLRVTLESAVFGQEVLDHLGAALRTGDDDQGAEPPTWPIPAGVDGTDLVARLETVVTGNQDVVAIETPSEERVTYGELWAHATGLAELLEPGLGEDRRTVAIIGDKHPNEIACVLGTHVAGATVLRLDRDEAATTRVLAGLRDLAAVIRLDDGVPDVAHGEQAVPGPFGNYRLRVVARAPGSPARPARPSPTLYITLTSGSTGQPKLIPFPRAAFNSLLSWHLRTFPAPRRTLQFSKLSFDVAYHVIYSTLCGGGTLVTANSLIREDPRQLLDYLDVAHVQKLYLPTVLLRPLAEYAMAGDAPVSALREVIVAGGGMEITDEIRAWFTRTSASLFNHYGTSETQDVTSHLLVGPPANWPVYPPAGLPIDGVEVRIAGPGDRALPASLTGSVVVRTVAGDMATGDLGYHDHDGRLHIVGRADRVIKRRGFRVNLQALEATVARAPGIADAVAVSFPAAHGGTTLAVVASERAAGGSVDLAATARQAADTLGSGYDFALFLVPEIPRLANAKPDLVEITDLTSRMLSTMDRSTPAAPVPGGAAVLHAVRDLVDADVPEDARFLDAGLDSISLMSLAAALRQEYPDLTIADFFAHPTIDDLQAHLDHAAVADTGAGTPRPRTPAENEVAVVGMAGRFPGASDVDSLWEGLRAGGTALESSATGEDTPAAFVGVHGNLSDVDEFDHEFFGISPAEARRMDPQVRVFLELCWHALEDAGEVDDLRAKNVGVFAGSGLSTYLMNEMEPDRLRTDRTPFLEHNTLPQRLGNDRNYLTSTVSYRLGLTGPSIVVLAACATSLTAVHMARQALLNGECDIALAGGVSIIYPQPTGYDYVDGSVRSRCGACRPFDEHADGSVFGNGAGVVVLKRASDAKDAGNTVHAEVVGSAVNHDGSVKGSFSAPNPASQTRVIDAALRSVGEDEPRLDFVEAHGTATSIGDAIEWNALLASRINTADAVAPCVVGSVKSNIGHLDEAAGIAGFIKACLSVRDRTFPGTHGFTGLHPQLDGDDRFTVSATTSALPADRPVHGGISSFGMGGANCHVIVRSPAPEVAPTIPLAQHAAPLLLPVSARTSTALTGLADRIGDRVRHDGDRIAAADVVHTLSAGRTHFAEFRGVLRCDRDGTALLAPTEVPDRALTKRARLVWAFPGQGSGFSWEPVAELGRWPVFADTFRALLAGFADNLGPAFTEHVGEQTGDLGEPSGGCQGRCTVREQVLQFSFQLALARLLSSFGIEPDTVVGHSLGEITAAVCAGLLTEDAALDLVARRAVLMDSSAGAGFMAQLRCDRALAADLAAGLDLDIAAVNGPRQVVVAGDAAAADALVAAAAARDVPVTLLPVDKAFHSRMMAEAADRLAEFEPAATPGSSAVEFVGTNAAGGDPADTAYWTSQLTSPVTYAAACDTVLSAGARTYFVEIGFGATLANLLRAVAAAHTAPAPVLTGGVRAAAVDYLAAATATAYQSGRTVSWAEVNQTAGGRLTRLPGYPFKRTAIAPRPEETAPAADTFELSPATRSWIREHRVDGRCVVPAAGILALFATVARDHGPGTALTDVLFEWPIVFDADTDRVEAVIAVREGAVRELTLSTRPPGTRDGWVRNASAVLTDEVPATEPGPRGDQRDVSADGLYTRFAEQRLGYGPGYRSLAAITAGTEAADASWTAAADSDADDADHDDLGVPSGLVAALDGIVQLADVLDGQDDTLIRMPAHIAYAAVHPAACHDEPLRVHARRESGDTVAGALRAGDAAVVADLTGIRFQAVREARPVAHRQHWRAHVPVGADLPPVVADELARWSAQLSAPDQDVAEYQRQVGLLEAHAVCALAGTGLPSSEPAPGAAAQRRHRAFGRLMTRPCPETDESPDGAVTSEWSILRNTAAALPDYFAGTLDGESILFSGDGPDRLRSYYQNSFLLDRLNRALPDVVLAIARANVPRAVRVLEVGGGTGATTERVLDAFDEAGLPVDYTFTDLSDGLVRLAADRFGRRAGFRSTGLDLESDAALAGDYDVIIAVDVVHATKDVARTVDRLAGALTPSGALLVVEDLKQLAWVDVTFGLLDSWWSFDDGLRTDHPLLSLGTWRDLLSSRFAHLDVLRACLGVPIEDTVADEGLFVCANPRRAAAAEPAVLDLPVDATADTTVGDRVADLAGTSTAVVRFDTPAVLDPAQAERFAATLLRVLRAAEEHPDLTDVVIATQDAVMDGTTPRVLTAGSMAAALTRVAAAERRRVRALSLATDTGDGLAEQVSTLMTHGHAHLNAVVLDGQLHLPHVVADEEDPAAEPDRDAAVLFGGTSGIAMAAAEWLHVRSGIDRLYLVGRSPRPAQVDALAARLPGAEVTYLVADVTDPGAVRSVAAIVAVEAARPLVLNLAAVLRDGTIDGVDVADLAAVFGPKVLGSHTIADAFRDHGARFVLFSSTSALLGNAGQAAHAMACAYLDGLAEADPATTASVRWGPWEDVGITARLGMNDRLRAAGENPLSAAVLLPRLGRAAAAGGTAIAADLDSPALRRLPFLAAMLPALPAAEAATAPATTAAPGPAAGGDVVTWAVATVLGVAEDAVDPDRTLAGNGVDSLHLIEVRSLLEQRSGVRVPLNALADAPSLATVRAVVGPAATGSVVFYVAGIFGALDAAPDLEDALAGSARLVTLSSPTRDADSPARHDLTTVAADLADHVEREQPTGPVTIAGHSFGARLAHALGVELRVRGRDLHRVVVIDGDPVAARTDQDATDAEFAELMALRAGGELSEHSRAVAYDTYRANCAIARSPQPGGELACPVLVVVPEQRTGVGLDTARVAELRTTGSNELGGAEIEITRVPGDHFTMLRSPNVTHLADHLTAKNSEA